MKKYSRVTYEVRCQINAYLQAGLSIPLIANLLGFNKSSIYRELKRNLYGSSYLPHMADKSAKQRYKNCRKPYKITFEVEEKLRVYLEYGWSPEQISGRFALEKKLNISHECIYQHIYKSKSLRSTLRRPKKRGFSRYSKTRCLMKNGIPLANRPNIANSRGRLGDWERDLFYGANRKQVLVCTDRKSRYSKIKKLESTDSNTVGDWTEKLILSLPRKAYTVTNDNGSEFKGNKIKIKTYFCEPRKPHQRGSVENTIGLIRQYLTRKTDLTKISEDYINEIETKLNFRPRKCLDYKTPFEVFYKQKVALAI